MTKFKEGDRVYVNEGDLKGLGTVILADTSDCDTLLPFYVRMDDDRYCWPLLGSMLAVSSASGAGIVDGEEFHARLEVFRQLLEYQSGKNDSEGIARAAVTAVNILRGKE